MRLFRQCNSTGGSGAELSIETPNVGIYNAAGLTFFSSLQLTAQFSGNAPQIANNPAANPCLTGDVNACYDVGTWTGIIDLPRSTNGYVLAWTRYTRRLGIQNVNSQTNTGGTFITSIPGTNVLPTGYNSSPQFVVRDTAIICKNSPFSINYSATDADGDSLAYKFAPAYDGVSGSSSVPDPFSSIGPPGVLSLTSLDYIPPYTSSSPLGSGVSIDTHTGVVSGTAPVTAGYYVVCVAVEEWRNGQKINEHRKDFILKIGDCTGVAPNVGPDERTCDGFTFSFSNLAPSANIQSYLWTFGDGGSSTQPQPPPYTYTSIGIYTVKLKVTATGGCQDSASKQVYVFPGFVPKFTVAGSCYLNPYQFTSTTFTAYGTVDTTKWNFGDLTTLADTSYLPNPTYTYPAVGTYSVHLYATNTKGCEKDTTIDLVVADKPQIQLPFKDTLICSIDTLKLIANANGGNYTWVANPSTPNSIVNPNMQNPLVFPKDTTTYVVTVNNNGCINKDSIKVNVLNFITVDAGPDTAICQTDTFRLHPVSYALSYLWTASTGVPVDPVKYPLVQPLIHTKYYVKANLGKCQDHDSVYVKVAPYPQVNVTDVAPICFGDKIQLNATIVGSSFSWTPVASLLNANTLHPIAGPSKTTLYILSVTDTVGCPKPVKDTVTVVVIPPITANAGRDTAVVINQPLQMFVATNAGTGTHFLWTPNFALNNDTLQNPIATINITADSIKYHVLVTTKEGCIGQDDIVVKVFKTEPDIFVPTAFTPNRDGKNDILKPICVGIVKLDYFRVFNRWGQMLFETREFDKGWDGSFGGTPQQSGTYVFMAQGTDYAGKAVFRKGTVVLIQ